MLRYILKKLVIAIPVLFLISVAIFSIIRLSPSDPVTLILGPLPTEEARARTIKEYRLDEPILVQYGYFLSGALQGDFGRSYYFRAKVSDLLAERLQNTVILGGTALLISYLIAVPLGVLAAIRHRTWIDHIAVSIAYAGQCIPGFVVAMGLILIFAYKLGWFPASGYRSPIHLVLPASALAFEGLALSTRIMRTSMLEVLGMDYIRTLRAKGLSERLVIWRHALKNALIPVISVFALRLGWLLGGAVAVEVVFGWPGAGRLLVDAVSRRDYPLIQGVTLVLGVAVVLANLLADILYAAVNPRIRY